MENPRTSKVVFIVLACILTACIYAFCENNRKYDNNRLEMEKLKIQEYYNRGYDDCKNGNSKRKFNI